MFSFPTIASNCAACTAIAVMYNADDTFRDYYYPNEPAIHTFINTKIIAEAPENFGQVLEMRYQKSQKYYLQHEVRSFLIRHY